MRFPILENLAGVSFQCLRDKDFTPKRHFKSTIYYLESAYFLHIFFNFQWIREFRKSCVNGYLYLPLKPSK